MKETSTMFFLQRYAEFINYHVLTIDQMCPRNSKLVIFRMKVMDAKVKITENLIPSKCEQVQPFWVLISLGSLGESALS